MEKVWQMLRRLNVQLIAVLAVLALLAIIVWNLWTAQSTSGEPPEALATTEAEGGTEDARESFFSWSPELRTPRNIARNPFRSPILDDYLAQQELERIAAERAAAERAAAERAAAAEARAAQAAAERAAAQEAAEDGAEKEVAAAEATRTKRPAPAARQRDVVLVYRGMMTRPDQVTLALVENRTDDHTAFYTAGDRVADLRVGAIERNTLEVERVDGSNLFLRVNEPSTFKETL